MQSHRFQVGDHLSSPRALYTHHGIYLGGDSVIHYAGFAAEMSAGAIEITSLDDFTQGQGAHVVPHPNRKWSVDETIERAYGRLGEDWYSLLFNNCEHFAYWCIEGQHKSPQVDTYAGYTLNALTYATLKRQAPEVLNVVLARFGINAAGTPVVTTVATSMLTSSVAPSAAPAIVNAVTSGAVAAGVAGTASYGGAAVLSVAAGATAPISIPTVLIASAAVGLCTYFWKKISD